MLMFSTSKTSRSAEALVMCVHLTGSLHPPRPPLKRKPRQGGTFPGLH